MMSLLQALEFTVKPRRAVHSDLCVRLKNYGIDQGPVELGQLTSQSRCIPSISRLPADVQFPTRVVCPLSEWADAGETLNHLGYLEQDVVAKF